MVCKRPELPFWSTSVPAPGWAPAVSGLRGAETVRSRRGRADSAAYDAASRPPAPYLTAPGATLNGSRTYLGDGHGAGQASGLDQAGGLGQAGELGQAGGLDGAGGGPVVPQAGPQQPAPHAGRFALKNWRVRSRLLLLVLLPTLAALILGGFSVVASARSALAYQRVEQFSRLGGEITSLVQALQAEREDTIRYITMGPAGGGRGAPAAAAASQLAVLTQDRDVTDRLAARVRSGAPPIRRPYPARGPPGG